MKASRKILPPEVAMASGGMVPDMGDVPIPGQMPPQNVPQGTMASPMPAILAQSQGLGAQVAGQYNPQMRNQLYQAMLERQNSLPQGIGSGLASVGDAIARGYGHGTSNFLDSTLKGQQDTTKGGLDAFDSSAKMNMQQTQAGMELGKMDPTSAISKAAQAAYEGPLSKLGYTKEQVAQMPASSIESVAQVALKYGDIESQKELKEATLQLQAMLGNATVRNQQSERAQRQQEIDRAADTEAAKHWALHPQLAAAARERLAKGGAAAPTAHPAPVVPPAAPGHTFATEAEADKAGLADGTPVVVGGVKGTWRHK